MGKVRNVWTRSSLPCVSPFSLGVSLYLSIFEVTCARLLEVMRMRCYFSWALTCISHLFVLIPCIQSDLHRWPSECGVCPHPQREEEGQRGGPHGPGRRREGPRGHPGRRHGRHLRYHLQSCWEVSNHTCIYTHTAPNIPKVTLPWPWSSLFVFGLWCQYRSVFIDGCCVGSSVEHPLISNHRIGYWPEWTIVSNLMRDCVEGEKWYGDSKSTQGFFCIKMGGLAKCRSPPVCCSYKT